MAPRSPATVEKRRKTGVFFPTWFINLALQRLYVLLDDVGYLLGDIVSYDDLTVGTGTLGMDNALGNTLSGKVGKLVKKIEVLDEDGSVVAYCEGVLVVVNRMTL